VRALDDSLLVDVVHVPDDDLRVVAGSRQMLRIGCPRRRFDARVVEHPSAVRDDARLSVPYLDFAISVSRSEQFPIRRVLKRSDRAAVALELVRLREFASIERIDADHVVRASSDDFGSVGRDRNRLHLERRRNLVQNIFAAENDDGVDSANDRRVFAIPASSPRPIRGAESTRP